jgi:hypothetical protein
MGIWNAVVGNETNYAAQGLTNNPTAAEMPIKVGTKKGTHVPELSIRSENPSHGSGN